MTKNQEPCWTARGITGSVVWDYPRSVDGSVDTYPGLKILYQDIGNKWMVRVFIQKGVWTDHNLNTRSLKKAKALALLF